MSKVEEWVEGKHPALAATAIKWASMVDSLYELFCQLKERLILGKPFQVADLSSWVALYQSEAKLLEIALSAMTLNPNINVAPPNFGNKMEFIARTMTHSVQNETPKPFEAFTPDEENKLSQEMLTVELKGIKQEYSGKPIDATIMQLRKDFFHAHEMETGFIALVVSPCFVLYQTFPGILYRKAIRGDYAALEKLLRIDRRLLHDIDIARQLELIHSKNVTDYNKLIKDSLELPKPRITRQRILNTIAGSISAVAKEMNQPLTQTDIRDLFNSISIDKHGILDKDIPQKHNTFDQAIIRARENWLDAFQELKRDKTI